MLRNEDTEMVKASVTMRDLCEARGIKVDRSGFAKCPFHGDDKHPSMKIYPGKRGYHCFTCGEGGDVITFVMRSDGLTFEQAVRSLAETFGVPISDGRSPLSREYLERIDRQREAREREELRRVENKTRLRELSELIRAYEEIIDYLPPMSSLWAKLMHRKVTLEGEWEMRFGED